MGMEDGMDMEGEKDMNRKCIKQNGVFTER